MRRTVQQRLQDAVDAMRKAGTFIEGMSASDFASDLKTLYAVEHCFIIVGEALRHVPEDVQLAHPEVPWRDIAGMRNRIAHDYLYTDRELIYQTVRQDFPPMIVLLDRLAEVLRGEGK